MSARNWNSSITFANAPVSGSTMAGTPSISTHTAWSHSAWLIFIAFVGSSVFFISLNERAIGQVVLS